MVGRTGFESVVRRHRQALVIVWAENMHSDRLGLVVDIVVVDMRCMQVQVEEELQIEEQSRRNRRGLVV